MYTRYFTSFVALCLATSLYAGSYSEGNMASTTSTTEPCLPGLFEISLGYNYLHLDHAFPEQEHLHGGDVSAFINLTRWLGLGGDFMANFGSRTERQFFDDIDLDSRRFTYMGGLRITPFQTCHFRFFAEALAGATHAELEATVRTFSRTFTEDSFAGAAGGGIDWRFTRHIAWRVVQADYLPTHLGNDWQQNFRVSTGVVFSFGGRN